MIGYIILSVLAVNGVYAVDSLRFLVIGDWGGQPKAPYKTPIETAVAKQMASVSDRYQTSFILALGDNFYDDGVTDVDDKRFKYTFEDVYTYESLMIPWYFVAGNHDHRGNVSAQIAYSNRSTRWNFPNYYYPLKFSIPGGKTVQIVMVDTVMLCGNTKGDEYGMQPEGPDDVQGSENQWQWIEAQLQTSTADYLLVAGHFPVYSVAERGPTKCLASRLQSMLFKYGVTAYLCGHDHNLQHLTVTEQGQTVDYILSGAADKINDSTKHKNDVPNGSLKFYWAEIKNLGGFAFMEATSSNMTFTFVDGTNNPLYQHTMFPRK